MIPDAAVEAAVATLESRWYYHASAEGWREIMLAALEAAAPHLAAFPMGMTRAEWEKYVESYR